MIYYNLIMMCLLIMVVALDIKNIPKWVTGLWYIGIMCFALSLFVTITVEQLAEIECQQEEVQ